VCAVVVVGVVQSWVESWLQGYPYAGLEAGMAHMDGRAQKRKGSRRRWHTGPHTGLAL
jgi:hypothetical protein